MEQLDAPQFVRALEDALEPDAPQFMRALEDAPAPAATLQLRTGAIGSRVVAWCVLVIAGLVALLMLGLVSVLAQRRVRQSEKVRKRGLSFLAYLLLGVLAGQVFLVLHSLTYLLPVGSTTCHLQYTLLYVFVHSLLGPIVIKLWRTLHIVTKRPTEVRQHKLVLWNVAARRFTAFLIVPLLVVAVTFGFVFSFTPVTVEEDLSTDAILGFDACNREGEGTTSCACQSLAQVVVYAVQSLLVAVEAVIGLVHFARVMANTLLNEASPVSDESSFTLWVSEWPKLVSSFKILVMGLLFLGASFFVSQPIVRLLVYFAIVEVVTYFIILNFAWAPLRWGWRGRSHRQAFSEQLRVRRSRVEGYSELSNFLAEKTRERQLKYQKQAEEMDLQVKLLEDFARLGPDLVRVRAIPSGATPAAPPELRLDDAEGFTEFEAELRLDGQLYLYMPQPRQTSFSGRRGSDPATPHPSAKQTSTKKGRRRKSRPAVRRPVHILRPSPDAFPSLIQVKHLMVPSTRPSAVEDRGALSASLSGGRSPSVHVAEPAPPPPPTDAPPSTDAPALPGVSFASEHAASGGGADASPPTQRSNSPRKRPTMLGKISKIVEGSRKSMMPRREVETQRETHLLQIAATDLDAGAAAAGDPESPSHSHHMTSSVRRVMRRASTGTTWQLAFGSDAKGKEILADWYEVLMRQVEEARPKMQRRGSSSAGSGGSGNLRMRRGPKDLTVWCGTWNAGKTSPPYSELTKEDLEKWLLVRGTETTAPAAADAAAADEPAGAPPIDLYAVGFQELDEPRGDVDDGMGRKLGEALGSEYTQIHAGGHSMGQIRLFVFARRRVRPDVKKVSVGHVAAKRLAYTEGGVAYTPGVFDTKGGVALAVQLGATRLCFASAHLEPHQGSSRASELLERNRHLVHLFQHLPWQGLPASRHSRLTALENIDPLACFDHTFLVGDLNYRLGPPYGPAPAGGWKAPEGVVHDALADPLHDAPPLPNEVTTRGRTPHEVRGHAYWKEVVALADSGDYGALYERDQLHAQQIAGTALCSFGVDGPLPFRPTFKLVDAEHRPEPPPSPPPKELSASRSASDTTERFSKLSVEAPALRDEASGRADERPPPPSRGYNQKRIPSYCDRILVRSAIGNEARQLACGSAEHITLSDHTPTWATYALRYRLPPPRASSLSASTRGGASSCRGCTCSCPSPSC